MARLATHDDDTQSVYSDLTSLLESDTDEFGRKLYQHTKDAQRIHAINGSSQAFRKARPNPRIALTLDNLQRNGLGPDGRSASDDALVRTAPSVTSSVDSDLPLNLPREWGRRGRHNNDWLKRIHQDEQHEKSPNIDWAAAADQSVEPMDPESSPSRMPSRQGSTPPSAHQQNTSLDRIGEWEADQDLTAASLLTSTPALRPRPRQAIDEIRQREIDGVEKAAVTSSRRQVWERSNTRQVSPSGTKPVPRRRSLMSNKENVPTTSPKQDRSPSHLLSKSVESIGAVDQAIQANVPRSTQRPQNQRRTDSMALLKRLARVSSNSPSPTSIKQAQELERTKRLEDPPANNPDTTAQRTVEETPVPVRLQIAPQIVPETDPAPRDQPQHGARADEAGLQTQTPVVTGAWVNTPRTERRLDTTSGPMNMQIPEGFTEETIVPRRRSEPTLPTSALAAVLEDMRRHGHHEDNDPTLGDSTIASLEGLMDPSIVDPTITLNIPDSALQDPNNIDTRPTTQEDRNQRQEELALEALSRRLNSTRTSIHEANEGLRNIEHQDHPAAPATSSRAVRAERRTRQQHQCDGHCDACGRHTSVFRSAWSEYWGLYFRWDDAAKWGWRLTWFGLACVAFWTWLATEMTLWYVLFISSSPSSLSSPPPPPLSLSTP